MSDPQGLTPTRALEEASAGLLGPEVNRPPGCRKAPAYPSHLAASPAGLVALGEIVSGEMVRW